MGKVSLISAFMNPEKLEWTSVVHNGAKPRMTNEEVRPQLKLGVTKTAIMLLKTRVGFPETYARKVEWITKAYGEAETGYDFKEAVAEYMKQDRHVHNEDDGGIISLAELLEREASVDVGKATVFISHVQIE